jgi:hypothetical protein
MALGFHEDGEHWGCEDVLYLLSSGILTHSLANAST